MVHIIRIHIIENSSIALRSEGVISLSLLSLPSSKKVWIPFAAESFIKIASETVASIFASKASKDIVFQWIVIVEGRLQIRSMRSRKKGQSEWLYICWRVL
ncbi:hypothetical protein PIB30_063498 [Stylosanthes scabra]|uniref:Uncharacterized protein n=1 Tax=Stylosanthes scabra TaxID=79078 RepID=A0ABU6QKX9_9FABA|nr:hypothetical protein [Stylosanthes scabra]